MYAFLADVHLGVKLPRDVFFDSLNYLFDIIKKHDEECKQIFVCGDLFDHRLNPSELTFAAEYLVKLICNKCRKDGGNVPVTMIHGTYSHDQEQYMIFIPLIEKMTGVRVRYIQNVSSFKIDDDRIKCLAIPQEYGDIDYTKAFSDKYDIIIGHGPVSSETKSPCPVGSSEILMSVDQLGKISKVCVFGHYHEYTDFGANVFYAGSSLRWRYGEPSKKVFLICDDNWNVTAYDNPFAVEYVAIQVNDIEELREALSQDITTPHRFTIHVNDINTINEIHALANVYRNNKNISFRILSDMDREDPTLSWKDSTNVPDTSIEPIPSLITYIKDRYNVDSESFIKDYENKIKQKEGTNNEQ